ncbi:SUN domain-containing ossification factor-like isoform X2 [Hoplias malabaricus]|uniref:SUN domain-containing ossification factor-like isoform X2 n=1 Tax=Hoplias malabaricus TaxID=27720 RepID=UPI003461883B
MKRHEFALFCISVVFLCYWHPVQHGHCSEQNKPDTQNQPQPTQDITEEQHESGEKRRTNKELQTMEHSTQTETGPIDVLQTQETRLHENNGKALEMDGTTAELVFASENSIREDDSDHSAPESSIPQHQTTDLSHIPSGSVTATEPTTISEDVSSSTTVLPGSTLCSAGDDTCTSASTPVACEVEGSPPYDVDLTSSLPMVLENTSTSGTGKGTKTSLERANKGTNVSNMLNEQRVHVTPEMDPSVLSKDPEDIPTFDEWKKIMMEVENEKSQTTHTSCNGGSSTVKKVQKTTNYASVECGAKILSSNPEAKSTSAILMENMDVYMLNPCSNKIWFVIELCQPIQVKQLDIANFELFSSTPKDFLVSISDRYPTSKWTKLGTFHARDERTVQSFPLDEHLYAKYVKVELLSHFGSEHFCPLSLIRVFGTSMMEEYELNSEPSERPNSEDDDSDSAYLQQDDKMPKDIIGSAKDVIFNMVNIAANVLGGNPEDAARSGGNYSAINLNLTDPSGTPQTVPPSASFIMLETLKQDITMTTSVTQDADQSVPAPTALLSETPTTTMPMPDSLAPTPPDEEQIVTLLPKEEDSDVLDQSEQSSDSILQVEQPMARTEQDEQYSRLQDKKNCCERGSDYCSCIVSLEEYLLKNCLPLPTRQNKKKKTTDTKSNDSQSQLSSFSQETLLASSPVVITSSLTQTLHARTMETTSFPDDPTTDVLKSQFFEIKKELQTGFLELEPSLTSALPKPTLTDALASKATQAVDFLDSSVIKETEIMLPQQEIFREKSADVRKIPLLSSHSETASSQVVDTKIVDVERDHMTPPVLEKSTTQDNLTPSEMSNTMDQAPLAPPSIFTDQSVLHPAKTKTAVPASTLTAAPLTESLDGISITAEPKTEELLEEATFGGPGGNGQSGQPSSSDFYAEMPSSTEVPLHGSNQKESVFMRLNNRIKALEVNMSLSGRYLEQLSQRYRKQMEEMQKAFNKTIIKLQNTSRIAEEQDQKQTESIQVLQGQLENMTQLVLNLSLQVSQLQREVSDRHSYLLLSLVLCFFLGLVVCINFCRMSPETPSSEPDMSIPNTYSYCSSERDSYEDLSLKRRASYPFSQSSLQIPVAEGPNEAYNVETQRNTTGNKKKKHCKMKATAKPETITPTVLSVTSVPNGNPQYNKPPPQDCHIKPPSLGTSLSPFTFRDPPSEGSSEASSQSDEPSFCGISTCSRLCDNLPPPKCQSEKRAFKRRRSKPSCTAVVKQLLQPQTSSPGPTMQNLIKTTKELSATSRVEVTTISGLT